MPLLTDCCSFLLSGVPIAKTSSPKLLVVLSFTNERPLDSMFLTDNIAKS